MTILDPGPLRKSHFHVIGEPLIYVQSISSTTPEGDDGKWWSIWGGGSKGRIFEWILSGMDLRGMASSSPREINPRRSFSFAKLWKKKSHSLEYNLAEWTILQLSAETKIVDEIKYCEVYLVFKAKIQDTKGKE